MTNTLHRHGSNNSLRNDYVVFAIPCRGLNDKGSAPKLQEFLRLAAKYKPVNMGSGSQGSIFRPNKKLTPLAHWHREETVCCETVINSISGPSTTAVVYDNKAAVENLLRDLREADLGLSVNISALIGKTQECCQSASLKRHSVEYSLRFMGNTDRLAESHVLELVMMCGHGMISFNFARKMVDWVRGGRRTPQQAGEYLCRFCTCGVFNPHRAEEILRKAGLEVEEGPDNVGGTSGGID